MGRSRAKESVRAAYIAVRALRQFACPALVAGLANVAAAQGVPIQVVGGVAYGPLPLEEGDLYLPDQPQGRRPAVVLIHGGGWVSGSRADNAAVAREIAGHGLVVFDIDYRLMRGSEPKTAWPAQLVDVQLAVRFLRAKAAPYGVDPGRIGAMGDSAGGHLAVLLGGLRQIAPGDEAGLYANQSPAVQAVVDEFGPMRVGAATPAAGADPALSGAALAAAVQTASPLTFVSPRSAPTYILHGRSDSVVSFQDSERLSQALKTAGVPVQLVAYDGDHEFAGLTGAERQKVEGAAINWLVAQLSK